MPDQITLSESAVALLHFKISGLKVPITEQRLPAFRELAAAGIMEPICNPDGFPEADFTFTAEGFERREEIVRTEWDRIERERYAPPDTDISDAAKELLRTCITGRNPDGDETNRPTYRELVNARIMIPLGSFSKGDECVFRFTYWGWKRRFELAGIHGTNESA